MWHALRGPHLRFTSVANVGVGHPLAVRYRSDVGPFAAMGNTNDPEAWTELAGLALPGQRLVLAGESSIARAGWAVSAELHAAQLIDDGVDDTDAAHVQTDAEIVNLATADIVQMLALADLTQPGPFAAATIELGGYLGIRRDHQLVAMAGRRLHPPGWIDVSAVCTHPDHRGQGLSRRLLTAVVHDIHAAGQRAFLHVTHTNTTAAALYESGGFIHRADVTFVSVEPPEG